MSVFTEKASFTESVSEVDLPINAYYINVSKRLKLLKYISAAILILFVVLMIAINRKELTVENFKYFLKYLDTSSIEYKDGYQSITYSASQILKTEQYKGDLLVVNDETTTLYSSNGISEYSLNHGCENPFVVCSSKYVLVYDMSGNTYNIYNAFSEIYSQTLDYPISGAAICDNGMYAVITRTEEYRSAVFIYDDDFKLISRVLKEKYITNIAFSPDASKLIITSVYADEGEWKTEICVLEPYSDTESLKISLQDEMGLLSYVRNDGSFVTLTSESLNFYDADGNSLRRYEFGVNTPYTYALNEEYTVLAFNNNVLGNENTLNVYSAQGDIISQTVFDEKVNSVYIYDEMIYALKSASVSVYNPDGTGLKSAKLTAGCRKIIPDGDYLLCVYQTYTEPHLVSELFNEGQSEKQSEVQTENITECETDKAGETPTTDKTE